MGNKPDPIGPHGYGWKARKRQAWNKQARELHLTSGPREPFKEGNMASLRHGLHSKQLTRKPEFERYCEEQREACPWITEADETTQMEVLELMYRLQHLRAYLDKVEAELGFEMYKVVPSNVRQEQHKLSEVLLRYLKELGLTPASRAAIVRDLGIAQTSNRQGVEELARRGAALRASRASELGSA
jgi:hypothetical protein